MKVKAPKDFWAGLMFIAFGIGFAVVSYNYQMGTAVRMGPAYFPKMLGFTLAILGLAIFLRSFIITDEPVARFYMKPVLLVLGGVVVFALLLRPLGLVLATIALIFISALGGTEFKFKEVLILSLALVVFALVVFVKGLGLPFTLCPGALDESCQRIMSGAK